MTTPYSPATAKRTAAPLESLFRPRGVAIAGASNDPHKPGHAVLANLLAAGYPSHIAAIHPKESSVLGIPSYPDLDSVPGPVELLVLAVPAHTTPQMAAAIQRRVQQRRDLKMVVAIAGGFAEAGTEQGIGWQDELVAACRSAGVRLIGPNCLGVVDNRSRLDTTFLTGVHRRPSGISVLSQSGAMGAWLALEWASLPMPVGLNKFVSLGNMADLEMSEVMGFLAQDRTTRAIGLYLEGIPSARALIEVAGEAVQRKPVVVLKVGRTGSGGEAVRSHTGALAGADAIYDGAFQQHGIIRVDRVDGFAATLNAFDRLPLPLGGRVAVLTNAGGPGVYLMDSLSRCGVELGRFREATRTSLAATLPSVAIIGHPDGYVDMTGGVTPRQVAQAVATVLRDPGIDAVVHLFIPTAMGGAEEMASELLRLLPGVRRNSLDKPLLPVMLSGNGVAMARRTLEESGILTFGSADEAATALAALIRYGMNRQPPAVAAGADGGGAK